MLLKSLATGIVALGIVAGSLGAATLPTQAASYSSSNHHRSHKVQVCQTIWRHHHKIQICNWVWRSW